MRSLPGGMRRLWSDVFNLPVVAGALACVVPGCDAQFTGPYPCKPGYDSCSNPQANMCETDTTSDALNCGGCGTSCPMGAACTSSACGAAAVQLASLGTPGGNGQETLEVNSTAVFWMDNQNGQPEVLSVPIAGGTPTPVATGLPCQAPHTFAVDDSNVYYWSNSGTGFQGGPGNGGLVEAPLNGDAPTLLVPDNNGSGGNCPTTAVDATNVYWLTQIPQAGPSPTGLFDVPIAGGTATTLSMSPNYNTTGLAITPTDAIVQVQSNNGPSTYAAVPIAGGSPMPVPSTFGSSGIFTADATNIYFVTSGCPCNNNGPSYTGPPTGQVVAVPIEGGAGTVLVQQFTGQASSIAVDATNVYWSTDSAVWAVPIAGGPVSSVAGNLTGGTAPSQCSGGCGSSGSGTTPTVIAVDATSVYIADYATNVNAILQVPK
jgi:hypothetical protein